jgi:hypothetical protein
MEAGPPEAAGRSRLQTTLRCIESNGDVLNVREKAFEIKSQVVNEEPNASESLNDMQMTSSCIVEPTRQQEF